MPLTAVPDLDRDSGQPQLRTMRPARWPLPRRDINVMLDVALITLLLVSFASGWAASLQGMTEFGLHKYSSIAFVGVAGAHLAMHWRGLNAQLRRYMQQPPRSTMAAAATSRTSRHMHVVVTPEVDRALHPPARRRGQQRVGPRT